MRSTQRLGGMVLLAACIVAAPAALRAQGCGSNWKIPPVGSWAEWQGKMDKTRIAVVGQEDKGGKTLYRVEMAGGSNGGVMQMVVPGFPWQMDQVEEMVMQRNGQPPMKMSGDMMAQVRAHMPPAGGAADIARRCAAMKTVGEETVTVPAGTFKTTHYKDDTGNEVWISTDVPFGMIKYTGKDGTVSTLTGTGKDAKTAIVGTPTEMSPGMMMGPPKN